jgi:hypothetical protein
MHDEREATGSSNLWDHDYIRMDVVIQLRGQ